MKGILISLGLLCLTVVAFAQQVAKGLVATNGEYVGFYEYKPVNYNPAIKYPLIIFLHGVGEKGNGTSELPLVTNNAIPKYIKNGHTMTFTNNGVTETFLVLSPQLARGYGSWQNFYVEEMINHAMRTMSVDPNRIFLTGLSLGGGGVWKYASSSAANAARLTAIAPVCGTWEMVNACNITNNNLGVWAFHAKDDGVVGVGNTQGAQYAINQCVPNYPAIYTYYNDGNHGIWDRSYAVNNSFHSPNLYQWFLGLKKNSTGLRAPVANAGSDQYLVLPASTASLSGSNSTDSDGTISSYKWSQVSGPNNAVFASPDAVNTTVTGLVEGTYTFRLTVTDNNSLTGTDDVVVNVANGTNNQLPRAIAGNDFDMTLPMDSLIVDGYKSTDADGSIIAYQWSQLSGPSAATIASPASRSTWIKKMSSVGTYSFVLEVTDNQGGKGKDTLNLTIKSNQNPGTVSVNAGNPQTITLPTSQVQLSGNASTTVGSITSYTWSWVSGPTSYAFANPNSASTAVTQLVQGTYTFRLTARNSNNVSNTSTVTVTVKEAVVVSNNSLPIAKAGNDFDMQLPGDSLIVDAYQSTDADGVIVSYKWSQLAGPSAATLLTPNDRRTWIKRMSNVGTYSFVLEVTDNAGGIGKDTLNITMKGTANLGSVSVSAGANQSITLPVNFLTVTGAASTTAGTISSYLWEYVSGPNSYRFGSATSSQTQISDLAQGTYTFRLTARNSNGIASSATMSVVVNPAPVLQSNQAPVAVAGNDFDMYLPMDSLIFSAWTSYDPDGSIVAYKWSQIGGPVSVQLLTPNEKATWAKRMSVVGAYTYRVEVTDNQGAVSADTVVITMRSNSVMRTTSSNFNQTIEKGNTIDISAAKTGVPTPAVPVKNGVFPSLVTTQAQVRYSSKGEHGLTVQLFDMNGRMLKRIQMSAQHTLMLNLPVSDLRPGTYLIQIVDGALITNYRFIKQ